MTGIKRTFDVHDCQCPRSTHVHGENQMYITHGCRCAPCTQAHTAAAAVTRRNIAYGRPSPNRLPAIGTSRRLQALMTSGWSCARIAERIGVSRGAVQSLLGRRTVSAVRAAQISAMYDELWDQRPPLSNKGDRVSYARARSEARARGFHPPLAWDDDEIDNPKAKPQTGRTRDTRVIVDEVVVERLKAGQSVPTNRIEQRTALAELVAEGVPTAEIAKRLGMGLSGAIRTRNRVTARRSAA